MLNPSSNEKKNLVPFMKFSDLTNFKKIDDRKIRGPTMKPNTNIESLYTMYLSIYHIKNNSATPYACIAILEDQFLVCRSCTILWAFGQKLMPSTFMACYIASGSHPSTYTCTCLKGRSST